MKVLNNIASKLNFFLNNYQNLNLIEVNKQALLKNYYYFKTLHPESQLCPVLKSNAYGHGLKVIGKIIDREIKPPFLAVDSLFEAYELEKEGVKTPILILGYTHIHNFKILKKLNFHFTVYDEQTLIALNKYQPGAKIHLKIDSGMNRLGIRPWEVKKFIKLLKKYNEVEIIGIFTHLAKTSDTKGKDFTDKQISEFKKAIKLFEHNHYKFKWKHVSATGGAAQIFDPEFNLIRLGLGFYGLSPFTDHSGVDKLISNNLEPALKLKGTIIQIAKLPKGEIVSYDGIYTAPKNIKIGIISVGYSDGLDRRLSGRGVVKIGNVYCPFIGKICMNMSIINLDKTKNPQIGDEVTVFDNNRKSKNSITNSTKLIGISPYELLTSLSETTKRVVV